MQAIGYWIIFWMSLTVISPLRLPSRSTTRTFSMRCWWSMRLGLLERRPLGDGDQVLLGHQLARSACRGSRSKRRSRLVRMPTRCPCDVGDRHARDLVARHHLQRLADALIGAHGDGIDDHPRFAPLHLVHLLGLDVERQVLVDDADPALLGERDGEARLGHGVHRRGEDRDVQLDAAADLGPQVDLGWDGPRRSRGRSRRRRKSGRGEARNRSWVP